MFTLDLFGKANAILTGRHVKPSPHLIVEVTLLDGILLVYTADPILRPPPIINALATMAPYLSCAFLISLPDPWANISVDLITGPPKLVD
jgi:hypothetical protein